MKAEGKRLSPTRDLNERIYLFDNIKLIAILLVAIGHAIDPVARMDGYFLAKSVFIIIYSVHMPLFIFMSGLFLKPMDKQTKFPVQKVISFILIGIVLRIFNGILRLLLNTELEYSVLNMYDSYTWFIGAIAVFIALVWLFRNLDPRFVVIIAFMVGLMAGYDKYLSDKFSLMRIAVFFPFFLVGYYIKPENILKIRSKKWVKLLAVLFIVCYIVFCMINRDFITVFRRLFTGRHTYSILGVSYRFGAFYRLLCYIISFSFGMSVMCIVPDKNFGFVSKMGSKTLQIYFWHKMFVIFLEYFDVYGRIQPFTGSRIALLIYVIIAAGIVALCSLNIFSFPTKQLMNLERKKE